MSKKNIAAVLAFVVVAGGYYLWAHADSFLKSAIETYGSAATKTEVLLDRASVSLVSGSGAISGLTVGNPAGFSSAKALSLGDVSIKVDTASVTGNGAIVIDDITISKPEINYEMTAAGDSNLQALARNARSYTGTDTKKPAPAPGGKTVPPSAESRKVIIRSLTVKDGRIEVVSPLLKGRTLTESLPEIHITNLGGEKGASPAEVTRVLMNAVSSSAAAAATGDLAKQLGSVKGLSQEAVKGLKSGVNSQLKGLLVK